MPPRKTAVDVHVSLPLELKNQLKVHAAGTGQDASRVIERAVTELLAPPSKGWTLPRGLTTRLDEIVARFTALDAKLADLDGWIKAVDGRLTRMEKAQAAMAQDITSIVAILRTIQATPEKKGALSRLIGGSS
jgi:hypothetical protein